MPNRPLYPDTDRSSLFIARCIVVAIILIIVIFSVSRGGIWPV